MQKFFAWFPGDHPDYYGTYGIPMQIHPILGHDFAGVGQDRQWTNVVPRHGTTDEPYTDPTTLEQRASNPANSKSIFFFGDEAEIYYPLEKYAIAYHDLFVRIVKEKSNGQVRVGPCGFISETAGAQRFYDAYTQLFQGEKPLVAEWRFHYGFSSQANSPASCIAQMQTDLEWSIAHGAPMVVGSLIPTEEVQYPTSDLVERLAVNLQAILEWTLGQPRIAAVVYWTAVPFIGAYENPYHLFRKRQPTRLGEAFLAVMAKHNPADAYPVHEVLTATNGKCSPRFLLHPGQTNDLLVFGEEDLRPDQVAALVNAKAERSRVLISWKYRSEPIWDGVRFVHPTQSLSIDV